MSGELAYLGFAEAAELIRAKKLSPVEYATTLLARIERRQGDGLHARHHQPRNRPTVGRQIRPAVRQSDPSSPATGRRQIEVAKIAGVKRWLWRAVDQTGMVLDVLVDSAAHHPRSRGGTNVREYAPWSANRLPRKPAATRGDYLR